MKIYLLVLVLALSACCMDSKDPNCTVEEREKAEVKEAPRLITSKDGVNLYCTYCDRSYPVYFTTPCGDTNWTEEHSHGKGAHEYIPRSVNGVGCAE